MTKKKISAKHGFSFKDMQPIRLKRGVNTERHDPTVTLKDPNLIFGALVQSLKEGDCEAFKEILAAHLAVINKETFSRRAKISKRTLFRMVSPDGNPTLDNIAKVVHALRAA